MTITWDAEMDAKLLTAIITTSVVKIDYGKVAEVLGEGCSVKALRHRIAKIRDKANLDVNTASGSPSPPTTAAKRKRGIARKVPKSDKLQDKELKAEADEQFIADIKDDTSEGSSKPKKHQTKKAKAKDSHQKKPFYGKYKKDSPEPDHRKAFLA